MQITISDKTIANLIGRLVDNQIFDNWDKDVIKAAKIPKRATLVKEILADEKYMKQMGKYLNSYINDADVIYDAICDADCGTLAMYEMACDKAYDAYEETQADRYRAQEIARAVNLLKEEGYDIKKAA